MHELADAYEHLGDLIKEMQEQGKIEVESYAVDLAHVYAHLNSAWNSRNFEGEMTYEDWEKFRSYPGDLEPLA